MARISVFIWTESRVQTATGTGRRRKWRPTAEDELQAHRSRSWMAPTRPATGRILRRSRAFLEWTRSSASAVTCARWFVRWMVASRWSGWKRARRPKRGPNGRRRYGREGRANEHADPERDPGEC